jgi:hypothetical protein
MKFAQQRQLPLSLTQRSSAAVAASDARTVRWQPSAPGQSIAARGVIQLATQARPERARTRAVPQAATSGAARVGPGSVTGSPAASVTGDEGPITGAEGPVTGAEGHAHRAGRTFGRARLLHAIELFGSCMMIAAFLVLALFG